MLILTDLKGNLHKLSIYVGLIYNCQMVMTNTQSDIQTFFQSIVSETDRIAKHYFMKSTLKVSEKSNSSPLSEADLKIEQVIREAAAKQFPDICIVGEEYDDAGTSSSRHKLIIDPIDGTANFIRGIPFFGTLLALEVDGEVIDGFISAPALNTHWWASKNKGAFHNHNPIQVSTIHTLSESQSFHGSLYGYEATGLPDTIFNVLKQTYRQRGFGDFYAPMLIAMGCGELCVDFNLQFWDIAPIKIILEEAGGKLTDIHGQSTIYSNHMVCSNGRVHDDVLTILNA